MASDVKTKILDIQVRAKDALDQIAKYRKEVADAMARQKELKKELDDGSISEEEYGRQVEASRIFITQQNQAINMLTRQLNNQEKAQAENLGSLVQWRAELSKATAEYDRLSKAEREGLKGTELRDHINEITTALKMAEEGTQRYFRNVGNYPEAVKPLIEQLNQLNDAMAAMEQAGKASGPEFENLKSKAEELEKALEDVNENGTPNLNDVIGKVNEVATALVVWKNVSKELGMENETVTNIITGLGTALTVYKAITTTATSATKALTIAQKAFNLAMKANPVGFFVAAVTTAIAAVSALISIFNVFGGNEEKEKARRKANFEEQKKQLNELIACNKNAIESAKARGASEYEASAMSIEAKKKELSAAWDVLANSYAIGDEEVQKAKEQLDSLIQSQTDTIQNGYLLVQKFLQKYRDEERIAEIGETEFKKEQAQKDYENQIKLIRAKASEQAEIQYQFMWDLEDKYGKAAAQSMDEYKKAMSNIHQIYETEKGYVAELESARDNRQNNIDTEAARKRAEEAKAAAQKRKEAQEKADKELETEIKAAQDALYDIIKEGLAKQLKVEQLSYERQLKALQDKLAKYQSASEYDIKMRTAIQQQIEALEYSHARNVESFQWSEKERQIKIQQELLQSKLALIQVNSEEEVELRTKLLDEQHALDLQALDKRLADELLTQEQYDALKLAMEQKYLQDKTAIEEDAAQSRIARQREELENEITQIDIAETEKQLHRESWRSMSDEEMEADRARKLEAIGGYEAEKLQLEEENAQKVYEALLERGQLSTQTDAEWLAEQNAAKQEWLNKQVAINEAYVKNEQAKQQAVRAVTNGLVSLLETLGDENSAYAKMAKVITLAQIAIDTGRALSSGIASASALPFPANLAAIATTVATVLANVATAISTVKSAKFATGGKVNGPGTGTSDSIPAMLSNGEYVMTARATKMFEPVLAAMNSIGSGVPIQVANSYESVDNAEMLTNSFSQAAREIKPVVSVVEITEAIDRVDMIENLDNF